MILEGRAFTADIGQPDRHPSRIAQPGLEPLAFGTGARRAAQEPAGPVHEEGAGIARAADEVSAPACVCG